MRCQARSSRAPPRYSVVAKPSLNARRLAAARPARPAAAPRSRGAWRSCASTSGHSIHISLTCDGNSTKSRGTFGAGERRVASPENRPCSAWPNSWKSVSTSSRSSSVGSPGGGFGDVEVVDHDGLRAEQRRLVDEGVHPRAAALGLARVEVERGTGPARLPSASKHLEDPHVRVVAGQVVPLGEGDAVELGRPRRRRRRAAPGPARSTGAAPPSSTS